MGLGDKFDNALQDLGGKLKEGYGHATDDEDLVAEGKDDQAAAKVKKTGEKVEDTPDD